jgi:hypothetical protein
LHHVLTIGPNCQKRIDIAHTGPIFTHCLTVPLHQRHHVSQHGRDGVPRWSDGRCGRRRERAVSAAS